MKFEIFDTDALGRVCEFEFKKKKILTPTLFPVIHPYNNLLKPAEIKNLGFNNIFTNAYILYQNEEERKKVLEKGIHEYLDFDGLIATDSGAFQQYMYHNEEIMISPYEIEEFEERIGSDLPVILDAPVQPTDEYEEAQKKVNLSIQRAKDNIKRRTQKCCWMGPIHGSLYPDLLKKSSIEMSNLDFGVYALGGLVKYFLDYRFNSIIQILTLAKHYLNPDKPIHMFGLGLPQFFSLAVAFGCDLMDSAAYILYAKDNRYFSLITGTAHLDELKEFPCVCPICSTHTPEELLKCENEVKIKLLAQHNLSLSLLELKTIRQAIREGKLWQLVEERVRSHPSLVNALSSLKKLAPAFEIYEKIYKPHGQILSSFESKYRPLIYRYQRRLQNRYRIPHHVKYLILFPQFDVKGTQSPLSLEWLRILDNNQIIPRKYIHCIFFSEFFGIIPIELINTYPMGQHEAIWYEDFSNNLYHKLQKSIIRYINQSSSTYIKCAMLIPDEYTTQFNEVKPFDRKIYDRLFSLIKPRIKIPLFKASNLQEILIWF
ncbi:MAG: tRNA-guanine(15) transglycosylase [Promethearchaeota archaeon]|nr:MAG: tRNA-guanine(15) transglycosylase [Candidatus Lokiarchaeota archaeon]